MRVSERTSADDAYDVFLSYSHQDKLFAEKLEQALRKYRPPLGSKAARRPLRVFRDDSEAKGTKLSKELLRALAASRKLIVICSPAARESPWVNAEITSFATNRGSDNILAVLAGGLANEEATVSGRSTEAAFPPALLSTLSDTPWASDFRRVTLSNVDVRKTWPAWFHLLAGIYELSREDIEKRERNRRIVRAGSMVTVFLITFGTLSYVATETPSNSWMPTVIGPMKVERVAVVMDQRGTESIRVVTRKSRSVLRHYEGARTDLVTVLEMNSRAVVTGCLAYEVEQFQVIHLKPDACDGHGGQGSMLDEWKTLGDQLENFRGQRNGIRLGEVWPYLLRNAIKAIEIDRGKLSASLPHDEGLEYLDFSELNRASGKLEFLTRGASKVALEASEQTRKLRVFRLDRNTFLGLAEVAAGEDWEDRGTLPVLTRDGGANWVAGKRANDLDSLGVMSISKASLDGKVLYTASIDNRAPDDPTGRLGGVFRSDDGGLSWRKINLEGEWKGWSSFSDVGTRVGAPAVLVLALNRVAFKEPRVIMTRDLRRWKVLDSGLSLQSRDRVRIIGVTGDFNVLALVRERLMVWRGLSWIERIQGRYGVPF